MQILHIYKDYYPVIGGIENHVKLLAEAQAGAGHQVTVLATNRSRRTDNAFINGVRVIKAGRSLTIASTPISLRLLSHLARLHPDITHLHFPYPLGEMAQYWLGKSRHTVLSYHSDVVHQVELLRLYRPLMLRMLDRVERIIVTSKAYLASSPILPAYADKCRVVPLGIDQRPLQVPNPEGVAALRRQYGDGPLILFVGVLRYYKGLQYLIEAMRQVEARLLIVGGGPLGANLRQQAYRLGLSSKVFFAGRVSDSELPAYYQAADCFVLPASERSEAFGLVLVEALASGLPIVSTELRTGTSFVNLDGVSGLVIPPRDPQFLAQALNRILSDDQLRATLAQGARARAALFEADHMVASIIELYEQLDASS